MKNKNESIMDAATVNEVIERIGSLFDHIPYAVCGTAALVYYGYTEYFPDHVSITCPEESKEAIRCWAVAKGMTLPPNDPNGFHIRISDGRSCAVAIRFMKSGFEYLARLRVGPSGTSIVTLPSIANTIARSYVARLHTASPERQAVYAKYLTWTLRKIISIAPHYDEQRLIQRRARDITNRSFWIPFTLCYPETIALFAKAGLDVIGDMPREWQAEDEMLDMLRARGRSSFHSYHTMTSDDDSENSPSLRRVTRRLPTRPLITSHTFSTPSRSDSEVSASPEFILSSNPVTPTSSRHMQFHRRTTSDLSQTPSIRRRLPKGVKPTVWI